MPKRRPNPNRKVQPQPAAGPARRNRFVPFIVAGVALLVAIGGGYLYVTERQTAQAMVAYAPDDVVRDRPIHAVHEMGSGPPIPFLSQDQPQPEIAIPEKSYNFGGLWPTAVVRHEFVIRNTGQAPLTISRAYTTCGCTTADITARVIPPGKVALASVVFDAGFHDTRGQRVRRGVIIENNDPGNSKAEIWVRASVSAR